MNAVHDLKRLIDFHLQWYERERQDAESTVLSIVHEIAGAAAEDKGALSALSYFLEVAPKEIVKAGAKRMTRLKNDTDFMIPLFWTPCNLTDEEQEGITLKKKAMYEEIYDALKREAAS